MRLRTMRTETVDIFNAGPRAGWRMGARPSGFFYAGPAWLLPPDLCLISRSEQSTMTIDLTFGLEIRRPKEWK